MKTVLIKFLGRFELPASAGGPNLHGGAKPVLLLARLALPPGQVYDRKRLAAQFWPDHADAQALASLRQSLWSLRRALGESGSQALVAERASISLDPAAVEVDGDFSEARAAVAELKEVLPITNLGFYVVLGEGIGTPEQGAHFIEGLRRAGIPEWPYGDHRPLADRLGGDDLRALVSGRTWKGALKNGVAFVQVFDDRGAFAYRSPSSLLSGRVTVKDDLLCQVIEGYLLNRQTCGYVYRNATDANAPGLTYAYVSINALKYFSVSP